jgi:hypothetical protein
MAGVPSSGHVSGLGRDKRTTGDVVAAARDPIVDL